VNFAVISGQRLLVGDNRGKGQKSGDKKKPAKSNEANAHQIHKIAEVIAALGDTTANQQTG